MAQPETLRPALYALLTGESLTAAQMADQGETPAPFVRIGDAAMNIVDQAYHAIGDDVAAEVGSAPNRCEDGVRLPPPTRTVPAWARVGDRFLYVGVGAVALFFVLRTAWSLVDAVQSSGLGQ